MSVVGVQDHVAAITGTAIAIVAVPAVVWGLVVGVCATTTGKRSGPFVAALLVGAFGLVVGLAGLATAASIPSGEFLPGAAAGAGLLLLGGSALLAIGAVIGLFCKGSSIYEGR